MNLQERTAYHEAGHARIAYEINFASVGPVKIFEGENGWEGDATINQEGMTAIQRAAIAIAGLLAEARAAAMQNDQTRRIQPGEQLTAELGRVIGIAVENRLAAVPANIPTTVPPAGVAPVPATLSLEDMEYIPDEVADDDEAIAAAAKIACDVINHQTEWASVRKVAELLIELQPEPIDDFVGVMGAEQ